MRYPAWSFSLIIEVRQLFADTEGESIAAFLFLIPQINSRQTRSMYEDTYRIGR
jgi:hypothetical protein